MKVKKYTFNVLSSIANVYYYDEKQRLMTACVKKVLEDIVKLNGNFSYRHDSTDTYERWLKYFTISMGNVECSLSLSCTDTGYNIANYRDSNKTTMNSLDHTFGKITISGGVEYRIVFFLLYDDEKFFLLDDSTFKSTSSTSGYIEHSPIVFGFDGEHFIIQNDFYQNCEYTNVSEILRSSVSMASNKMILLHNVDLHLYTASEIDRFSNELLFINRGLNRNTIYNIDNIYYMCAYYVSANKSILIKLGKELEIEEETYDVNDMTINDFAEYITMPTT